MGLGTKIRLARLFSNPSGHLFGGAVDHFVGYGNVREGGLADLPGALDASWRGPRLCQHPAWRGAPPVVGICRQGSARHSGGCFTADDRIRQLIATPEDAVRYGADALAVAIPVRGATEGEYIRWLTDTVNAAARFEMPVVAHVYPRDFSDGGKIVFTPG
jgi:class I fructose-bisphosphate aldolase